MNRAGRMLELMPLTILFTKSNIQGITSLHYTSLTMIISYKKDVFSERIGDTANKNCTSATYNNQQEGLLRKTHKT